jgi:hypothetical protein
MRLLQRILLFFAELGVLALGLAAMLAVAYLFERSGADEGWLSFVALFGPLILAVVGFFLFRQRNRRWKIKYDAANYLKHRASQLRNPRRTRRIRILCRLLRWLPSACAALVLFFLPVASRLIHPGTQLVTGYRFSLPMNWIIMKAGGNAGDDFAWALFSNEGASRYGLTPMWFNHSLPSGTTFSASDPAFPNDWYRPSNEAKDGHPTHTAKIDFTMGTVNATCWEYRDTFNTYSPAWLYPPVLWDVLCSTQPNGRNYNLRASFLGQKKDLPAFYQVLKSAKPSN